VWAAQSFIRRKRHRVRGIGIRIRVEYSDTAHARDQAEAYEDENEAEFAARAGGTNIPKVGMFEGAHGIRLEREAKPILFKIAQAAVTGGLAPIHSPSSLPGRIVAWTGFPVFVGPISSLINSPKHVNVIGETHQFGKVGTLGRVIVVSSSIAAVCGDRHRSRGRRCLLGAQGRAVRSEPSPNCSHTNCGEGLTWFQSWHSLVGAKLSGSGLGGPGRCHSITNIEAACRSTKSHVKRFSMSAGAFVGASVSARFHRTQARCQRLDSHFLRARCAIWMAAPAMTGSSTPGAETSS
jgi:hypothetical protein